MKRFVFLMLVVFVNITHGQENLDFKLYETYNEGSNSFINNYKELYTYNTKGQLIETIGLNWYEEQDTWINDYKEEYFYDDKGNLISTVLYYGVSSTEKWQLYTKHDVVFNDQNLSSQFLSYGWKNSKWSLTYKEEVTYIGTKIDRILSYVLNDGKLELDMRFSFEYAGNFVLNYIGEALNNGSWDLDFKAQFKRNSKTNKIEEEIWESWNGYAWENDDTYIYKVDENLNRVEELFSYNDVPYDKKEFSFDKAISISKFYTPFNKNKNFVDLTVEDVRFYNKVLTEVNSSYDEETKSWSVSSRGTYHYSTDPPLGIDDNQDWSEVVIYPNPMLNEINFKLKEKSPAQVSIFDVNGRLIINENLDTIQNKLNVDMLQSGLYVCQVKMSNKLIRKHLVKK
ncbi:T9SS type A sorting domain-containing protein [Formosa haliotis]|uniref:T9SS type A sorting domain-containing protein n=1 Tax=Formosa haliotis TaxID=1555194 RepID=UPI00082707FF|nr:T9SS type A sorting domain-containing protein [Formosa haliotis]